MKSYSHVSVSDLVARASDRKDPDAAMALVMMAAAQMSKGETLHPDVATYISNALQGCVEDPEHAGQKLGLIGRARGRPKTVDRKKRARDDLAVAVCVAIEKRRNPKIPLRSNSSTDGIYVRVSRGLKRQAATAARVEKAWKTYRPIVDEAIAMLAKNRGTKSLN
jgi:hypothetical protein